MYIAGLKKTTLLDYPGKIATIIFTAGCNLRCRFCHNPEMVLPQEIKKHIHDKIDENAFFHFLDERKGFLDGVVICGGEPTLQPDLTDFAAKIKDKGMLVKLDTNGRDPDLLDKLITQQYVDYVAMDVKDPLEDMHTLTAKQEDIRPYRDSIDILRNSLIAYEFRTTVIKYYHTTQKIEQIAQTLKGATMYALQNFIPGNTLDASFRGATFTDNELTVMQQIAAQYVQQCTIRT